MRSPAAAVLSMLLLLSVASQAAELDSRHPPDNETPPATSELEPRTALLRVFTDKDGRTCRVYERRVIIDGALTTAFAIVCREASGRWVLSR